MKKSNLAAWGFASLILASALAATAALPNLDSTLRAQRKLIDAHPNDAVAHNDLGNLLEASGDLEAAEAAYQRAIALDSRSAAAHFNLALLYQQQKKDRKAIDTLEQLLEIDGNHAWAHYQLGVLFEKKGRRNAAIEQYAQAFALDSGLSFPRNNPQILDSQLATESLLRAESYLQTTENRVPRQFNDTVRIRNLMLTPQKDAAGDEIVKTTPPEEGSVAKPASGVGTSGSAGAAATETAPRVLTNDDLRGSSGGGAAAGGSGKGRARTTSTTSRNNTTGFAAPVSANPAYGAPVQRTPPNNQPVVPPADGNLVPTGVYVPPGPADPGRPTLVPPPTNNPTPQPVDRFRPGRGSTASLDWQLEPSLPAAG